MIKYISVALIFLSFSAFEFSQEYWSVFPKHFPKPTYDFSKNRLTKEKIELGRYLFYDPILSRNNTVSCASCHLSYTAFTHVDHSLSHGIEDKLGTRNSSALMNLAWQKSFMWDGAVNHLDVQALAPISHPSEMDEKFSSVIEKLKSTEMYPKLYKNAFGDSLVTGERTLKALSQFMLTLISANSKYDSVIRKKAEFTDHEAKGYIIFKTNCESCHKEPLFTNQEFKNNGLPMDTSLKDLGRMKITKNPKDSLKFKVPTLRNIEFSYPYMHDGRFKKLSEVIKHYTTGVQSSVTLAEQLQKPIVLSPNDKVDLTAFLLTLTDKSFLFNPNHAYPMKK